MIKYLPFIALLVLSGCAGALPWNLQNYAGINKFEVFFNEDGTPSHVLVIGGKEQKFIELSVELPSGLKAYYKAEGVQAFPGQDIRGRVEEAVSEDAKAAFPGLVKAIVEALE